MTIAGYTCEREELSGIFIKSVTEGSAAHRSGKVAVHDQIVEVDGRSIQGYTNQQAVEMLRSTGKTVRLKLYRYVRGLKFEQLQQAIANSQANSPIAPSQAMIRTDSVVSEEASIIKDDETEAAETEDDEVLEINYEGEISAETEADLIGEWSEIMGSSHEIVVAQMSKFKPSGGLGISLEGTVEKVDGAEQNPHHYIRSVLPNGPVGQNGRLQSGDELLEVNGKKLLGLYHTDVVGILKDLPMHVRLVCARPKNGGAEKSLATRASEALTERMVKAKSDGSISSSGTTTENSNKLKSRSLEPLSSLAMWSDEVLIIELVKGDRGLGFSILDYQDPMNKEETVIVIRSLVPGGVAQQDGRLIPGDRLMFVNEVDLSHASLDEAVQALKGATRGIVRVGVSKPLPVPDSSTTISQNTCNGEEDSSADNTEVRSEISDMNTDIGDVVTPPPALPEDIPPPVPTSPLPNENPLPSVRKSEIKLNPITRQTMTLPSPTERLIGSELVMTTRQVSSPEDVIPPLPEALERTIKVKKDSDTLGVQVDIEDNGINGLVVRSVAPGGTVGRDGRIHAGDYLVRVNGENMKNISHGEALEILRRTHMIPLNSEISICYIPATDAAIFKTSMITRLSELESNKSRPTPAARTTTPSASASSTVERKKKASTIISIEAGGSSEISAPLVSPEAAEEFDIVESRTDPDSRKSSAASSITEQVKASTVYIKAVTEDESTTDPPQQVSSPPPPPPRPSKTPSSSSSLEASPKHAILSINEELPPPPPLPPTLPPPPQPQESEATSSVVDDETSKGFSSQQWGSERRVEIRRVQGQGLGISTRRSLPHC